MQEFRIALETLPGVGVGLDMIDRVHDALDLAAAGFANTSLVGLDTDTGVMVLVIFLDAITAYIALGTALNIATRALNEVGIAIPSAGFGKIETEITDFIAPSVSWPSYETEEHVPRQATAA